MPQNPKDTVYSVDYIRKHGVLTVFISEPLDADVELGAIAVITIEVKTPCDPSGKCTARMDIRIMNPYRIGCFDMPQDILWEIGLRELRVLRAFPWLHDILISGENDCLSLPSFLHSFEESGGNRSKSFDDDYSKIKTHFDITSQPTFEEQSRPN